LLTERSGFKERFYGEKFGVSPQDADVVGRIVQCYVEGLQWCYLYYYQGVP
jgi:5'-3' exonuclease